MNLDDLPVVSLVTQAGADDRIFDILLLAGPFVVALIAVFGRTVLSEAVAVAYVGVFLAYVVYRGTRN